jgi:hypothetical protein
MTAGTGCALVLFAAAASAQQVTPSCTEDSRECMIEAATAYLDSIVAHDASKVPLAPNVVRTEQRFVTGTGEDEIRLKQKLQPDMRAHANTRFVVDEATNNVVAFTLLQVTGKREDPDRKTFTDAVPAEELVPSTVHLIERFKVEKGLITEIEAIFYIEQGTMDGKSNWPDAP